MGCSIVRFWLRVAFLTTRWLLLILISRSPQSAVATAAKVIACDRVVIGRADRVPDAACRSLARALGTTVASHHGSGIREFVSVADLDTELEVVVERFSENPFAPVVASQVLRVSENLPIQAALYVESLAYSTLLGAPDFRRWLDGLGPKPLPPRRRRNLC